MSLVEIYYALPYSIILILVAKRSLALKVLTRTQSKNFPGGMLAPIAALAKKKDSLKKGAAPPL